MNNQLVATFKGFYYQVFGDFNKFIMLIQIPTFRISWDVTYMNMSFVVSAVEFVSLSLSKLPYGFCVEFLAFLAAGNWVCLVRVSSRMT